MKKVKIAQIGTSDNSHGMSIFQALKENSDIFEVAGYVLPENEREKFPKRMNVFEGTKELTLDEVLNNPEIEAVAVETEEIYLTKYALLCAKHKKHIHMEKPGSPDLKGFEELIKTVKENKTVFHTGYMYRYNPYIRELKEQIKKGELGDITSVEAHMSCTHPQDVRQWLENFPGGMMFFLGCHLVDLIYSIQGKPQNVIPLNKSSGVSGVTAKDFGMTMFEYENGISFAKTSAVEVGGFERRQLVVSGTKKTVELRPLEWWKLGTGKIATTRFTKDDENWHKLPQVEKSEYTDRYQTMIRSFGEMVQGKKENPWDYDYELELFRLVMKACGE